MTTAATATTLTIDGAPGRWTRRPLSATRRPAEVVWDYDHNRDALTVVCNYGSGWVAATLAPLQSPEHEGGEACGFEGA